MQPDSLAPLFAQEAEPAGQSLLTWMFNSLGLFYGFLIPAAGVAVFIGACLVVAMNRRPAVIAAYLVFVPIPLLIGIVASLHGFISSYAVVAASSSTPRPSDIAQGISMGLFASLVGLLVTVPAYLVIAGGLFSRTISKPDKP